MGLSEPAIATPSRDIVDPRTGKSLRTTTGAGAHTTALVAPDRLYVISPAHRGVLVLADA